MKLYQMLTVLAFSMAHSCAFAHDTESRVALELETPSAISAGQTTVSFQLVDTKTKKVVTPADLNVSNTMKLHFIAYDPALKEFQHVHPDFDGKVWNVAMNFAVNGSYFVWAEGQLSSDSEDFNSMTRIDVSCGQPAWPDPVLGDVRTGSLTGSVATLSGDAIRKGTMTMRMLQITKTDGTPGEITPYLGAFAHLIATPIDGDSLIHIHAMDGDMPNEGTVHVTFPDAGDYRIWVQFVDSGVLKTIPLSVTVID